jgi:hypothetical protein
MSAYVVRVVVVGLGLIVGVACSRHIEAQEPVDQERIDDYCSASCKRSADCGQLHARHGYATCFTDCSTGDYMTWGDDDARKGVAVMKIMTKLRVGLEVVSSSASIFFARSPAAPPPR